MQKNDRLKIDQYILTRLSFYPNLSWIFFFVANDCAVGERDELTCTL